MKLNYSDCERKIDLLKRLGKTGDYFITPYNPTDNQQFKKKYQSMLNGEILPNELTRDRDGFYMIEKIEKIEYKNNLVVFIDWKVV